MSKAESNVGTGRHRRDDRDSSRAGAKKKKHKRPKRNTDKRSHAMFFDVLDVKSRLHHMKYFKNYLVELGVISKKDVNNDTVDFQSNTCIMINNGRKRGSMEDVEYFLRIHGRKIGAINSKANVAYIMNRLGKDSSDGEAYQICIPVKQRESLSPNSKSEMLGVMECDRSQNVRQYAVKLIPLTKKENENKNDYGLAPWKEQYIMKKINEIVCSRNFPNLPMIYFASYCSTVFGSLLGNENLKAHFVNKELLENFDWRVDNLKKELKVKGLSPSQRNKLKRKLKNVKNAKKNKRNVKFRDYSNAGLLLFSELSDMDLASWMRSRKTEHTIERLESALFQICFALATLLHNFGIIHGDLHLSNVLVNLVNFGDGKNMKYMWYKTDDGTNYYVPIYSAVFRVWDFGRSILADHDSIEELDRVCNKLFKLFVADPKKSESIQISKNIKNHTGASLKLMALTDLYRLFSSFGAELRDYNNNAIGPFSKILNQISASLFDDFATGISSKKIASFEPKYDVDVLIVMLFKKFRKKPKNAKMIHNPKKPILMMDKSK